MFKYPFLYLFLLLLCCQASAQNTIGIPEIVNYSKQEYNAGSQNWGIAQDKNGIVYFANNQGLLSFDGTFWRRYQLPNKTIVRSVAIADDGRIYVGGQSEFGYFFPSANGDLAYVSLMPLLSEKAKDFTDVWNICIYNNQIYFRAYRKIFEYDGKKINVHDGVHWNFLGKGNGDLLAFEFNRGFVRYRNGQWISAVNNQKLSPDINIKATVDIGNDSTLVVTLTNGLFILHNDSLSSFTTKAINTVVEQNVYGAAMLGPDRIALITNLSGCIVIDKQGRFIQKISKKEGIQNNNILSLMLDRNKNLWLGLDNGIDLVLYNNAIRTIFPEAEDKNAGYASIIYQNRLYLGLATGAYSIPLSNDKDLSFTTGNFELVKNSKGQVWNFSEVNGQLLMGHNSGAYIINNDVAEAIDNKTGFWDFQAFSSDNPSSVILAGTYNGINFYDYKNGVFTNPKRHAHFESARFVVQHNSKIWIAHPFKGLYTVEINNAQQPTVTNYKDRNHILSDNHNKIFSVGDEMILTTDKGIFTYDNAKNDFVYSDYYANLFKGTISFMQEDRYGNLWFCKDKKIGVLDRSSGAEQMIFIPELNNMVQGDGFENILVIDSSNVLIAGEKGFFHLNYSQYKKNRFHLEVLIRNVRPISGGDSLLYGGYAMPGEAPSLSYALNSLHFESSATLFGQEHTIQYSYYLEGFDKGWSDWSKKAEKDYTNIPPGKYVFKVKCRNNFNNESSVASFPFYILPPWYRTWWAYSLYAALFFAALYFFYKKQQEKYKKQQQLKLQQQKRKYDEEQEKLRMQHQLELSESEKEIAQLKAEKLVTEVEHKNSELATSAMNLVHKVEILSRIKEDMIQFKETNQFEKGTKDFQKIIKVIDGELSHAQEWEQFAKHFDNVHTDYLKKLKERCPDLTASELKLAAYLRLNLSTKEIAQLMNISIRGVETSRYRLRKKFGLTNDEANLYDFLIQIAK